MRGRVQPDGFRRSLGRRRVGSRHLVHRQTRPFELRWTDHLKLPQRNPQTTVRWRVSPDRVSARTVRRHCLPLLDPTPRMAELVLIRRGQVASRHWSAQVRQVISELDELRVINRLKNLKHDRLVRVPRPALVFTQGLEQVILAPVGQTRHRLLPGKIRAVADIAAVKRRGLPASEPCSTAKVAASTMLPPSGRGRRTRAQPKTAPSPATPPARRAPPAGPGGSARPILSSCCCR